MVQTLKLLGGKKVGEKGRRALKGIGPKTRKQTIQPPEKKKSREPSTHTEYR